VTRRATAAATAALLALAVLTGCHSGGGKPHTTTQTVLLERLSAAIAAVNTSRQHLADDAAAIGLAAARLDDVDAAAVTGDRDAARAARPAAANAVGKAAVAARRLGKDVTGYDRAVTALAAAGSTGLDATQQQAVTGVVTAGRAEVRNLRSYATVIATVWPRYESLDANQATWVGRAFNGWYRDRKESAGGYLDLTDHRTLDATRRELAGADEARLGAARRASAAIRTARGALASLIG
jgi:hypothetical protein